jgi:hypothetical protein
MAALCFSCAQPSEVHPFEGLVEDWDASIYYVRCNPPIQYIRGICEVCDWKKINRVIPRHCPQCGAPTRVLSPSVKLTTPPFI